MQPLRRFHLWFILLYLLVLTLGCHWVWQYSYHSLLNEHQAQLERFSGHIAAKLDKYANIPRLLSKDRELIDALKTPRNTAQIEVTNRYLAQVNEVIQASDTYLLNVSGTTIAASNWASEHSFIGRNFAWRPYFKQAIQGKRSQYFALGSTSGQRGYYYAYPVIYAAETIGVVVVKMDLYSIEENWQSQDSYFVATDDNNVIFMSSQPQWLFRSVSHLNETELERIRRSRQYLDKDIPSLGFKTNTIHSPTEWKNPQQGWLQGDMIVTTRPIPELALNIRVLSPKMDVFWNTFGFGLVLTMLFAIIYLATLLVRNRSAKQRQIEHIQQEAKQKLEFLVMERTAELHSEIDERIKTEQALRQAQDELIQTAKLAMLGQMSASISHELNNPLAAIRSFADNARRFLHKGAADRVDDNLSRISSLTERMAKISEQLKSFARRSDSHETVEAQLFPIVLSAKELIQQQFKTNAVSLIITPPQSPINVQVNPIQLEQVLINLLTNAQQALNTQSDKKVMISFALQQDTVEVYVDDNGSGISQEQQPHLFDPFYTTKQNGLGLGLSISYQIIKGFDGRLLVEDSPFGGARFIICLPRVLSQPSTPPDSNLRTADV